MRLSRLHQREHHRRQALQDFGPVIVASGGDDGNVCGSSWGWGLRSFAAG
jgi:hypothetical protein